MIHRTHVEFLDATSRDIRCSNKVVSGITLTFSGDFSQTLPVIIKETRADIIKSCLTSSTLQKKLVYYHEESLKWRKHRFPQKSSF